MAEEKRLKAPRVYATLLMFLGILLLYGGGRLLIAGGSAYYLLAGAFTFVAGLFLWRGRALGAWLYALLLILTVAWSLWEVGFDGWALAPRLIAPFVLGIWLLRKTVRQRLGWGNGAGVLHKRPLAVFSAGIVGAIAVGAVAHAFGPRDPFDPAYRVGTIAAATGLGAREIDPSTPGEWAYFAGSRGGSKFSPLDQITPANVSKLEVAWTFHTGVAPKGAKAAMEATPIKVGPNLYTCTSYNDVIAIDAETGKQVWRFRSNAGAAYVYGSCRGVAYYKAPAATDCPERIITNTVDARLIALDARTGQPCVGFGRDGEVSLLKGMPKAPHGYYSVSSAPTIIRGKIVLGGWVTDNSYIGEPSGAIRAYDAITGKFAWAFDMGRPDVHTEPAVGETYTPGTPNSWGPMSVDEALGLVYAPTGNSTPDLYGGMRRAFDDKYSTSVLAIDAETGALRWSFQTLHHDLWDHDVGSQPVLLDMPVKGVVRKALIQPTKQGEIFVLDRVTGKPLYPVREEKTPTSGIVPGERISLTQPSSFDLPSFRGPDLTERRMWGLTPLDQLLCRIMFRESHYEGPHTPPGFQRSIAYPGPLGAINWGSVSVDPKSGLMFVNSNRFALTVKLITRADADARGWKPEGFGGKEVRMGGVPMAATPYAAEVNLFWTPLIVPCLSPPYGMLSAVDLKTGKLVWHRLIGTARDSGPLTIPSHLPIPMGAPNTGGSVATKSGLLFIGATQDAYLRAFNVSNGKELWRSRLPAGGQATPAIYTSTKSGRQFVVISAGGSATLLSPVGDTVVAYALPQPK